MSPQANSDRLRPRRRASQTHFFRYQQAANPLRAEDEDLKKALIASLQDATTTKAKRCTIIDQQKRVTSNKTISRKKQLNIPNSTSTSATNSNAPIATTSPNTTTSTKSNYATSKKYAALRKFASNQTRPAQTASPLKNCPGNETHDRKTNGMQPEYFPKTFKPETEDFLTFLCVRLPPPMFSDFEYSTLAAAITAHARGDYFNLSDKRLTNNITNDNSNNIIDNNTIENIKISKKIIESSSDARKTRQSARLNCQRKISESDSADDNSTSVEEDIKQTSLSLQDLDDGVAQETPDLAVGKYLIKGLMTSEFAGAFADEETLFDLVDNSVRSNTEKK